MTTQYHEAQYSVDADIVEEQDEQDEQEVSRHGIPLLEVIDRCLDKGLVIDAWASTRVVGVEVVTLEFRAYVTSFDKYLRLAEAIEQTALDSIPQPSAPGQGIEGMSRR